jgi:hypothetical protein
MFGNDGTEHSLMVKKLAKVREQQYVEPGDEISSTSFFAVRKGTEDIRMVYDPTKSSGLNENNSVPRFPLPTIDMHLRVVDSSTFMSNIDIGEIFLNFVLHKSKQALCGVDLSSFFGGVDKNRKTGCGNNRQGQPWGSSLPGIRQSRKC